MDKIGHYEEIKINQMIDPQLKYKMKPKDLENSNLGIVVINITTNGFSKILTISDKQPEDIITHTVNNQSKFSYLNYNIFNDVDIIMTKIMEIKI